MVHMPFAGALAGAGVGGGGDGEGGGGDICGACVQPLAMIW